MNKIKEINWFWKKWTESEREIYKKCATSAIAYIVILILAAIVCSNNFHASEAPVYDDKDKEIHSPWGTFIPGYHYETRWDDEKGEWYGVYVPDEVVTKGDIEDEFWDVILNGKTAYTIDDDFGIYIFRRAFNIIYGAVLPVTSVLAGTLASYQFCLVMTSKNPRKIEESYTHIRVIGKTWLYIMLSSVIITLAVQGFEALINSPAAQPILHP